MNKLDQIKFEDIDLNDIELIRKWRNSSHVSKNMYTDNEISSDEQVKWFNNIKTNNATRYWIIKYNNLKIGVVNLANINFFEKKCDWAFYIGDKDYIGVGIGFLIEFKFIEFIFNTFEIDFLKCEVKTGNFEVLNMHKKFGFLEDITSKKTIMKNGNYLEVTMLKLSKIEWQKLRNRFVKILK